LFLKETLIIIVYLQSL